MQDGGVVTLVVEVVVRVDQEGTFLLKLLNQTQNSQQVFVMSLGVSIKKTTKGFCEILPGIDQARCTNFVCLGFHVIKKK